MIENKINLLDPAHTNISVRMELGVMPVNVYSPQIAKSGSHHKLRFSIIPRITPFL